MFVQKCFNEFLSINTAIVDGVSHKWSLKLIGRNDFPQILSTILECPPPPPIVHWAQFA